MLTLSHNQCSYSNPLYNMVASIRHKLNIVNKVNAIRTASYLGDCSDRNSHDELKDYEISMQK